MVWAGMGTGKTASTLLALVQLSYVEKVWPALVIAPLRVAKTTWPDEIAEWADFDHLRCSVICGDEVERIAALNTPADVYTINYDNLPWLAKQVGRRWPFPTVIADEVTRLRSFRLRQGSKRAKALGQYAHTQVTRFIGLTGSPAPNGLAGLWGQLWFVDKGLRLMHSFSAFSNRWFEKGFDGWSLKLRSDRAAIEIHAAVSDVCLTVEGLPVDKPIENRIYVKLGHNARGIYKSMEDDMFADIGEHGVEAVTAAVKSNKLLQIANGILYTDPEERTWEEIHRLKLDALESVIEEANGMPVLVAYHYKPDLERILKAFPTARELDDNPKTIKDWNAGKIPILVAHPASAGHGLSLQHGSNILCYYSVYWDLENHEQIMERLGPQRQKQSGYNRPVYVHYILAENTVDDLVMERQETKRSVQQILLDAANRRKIRALVADLI